MAKPRPLYLQKEITRHGKTIWYVRKRPHPRIRIHGEYGSKEFIAAYNAAIKGEEIKEKEKVSQSGTLAWLIEQYKKSSAWIELSPATRKQRGNMFIQVLKNAGDRPYLAITRKIITASRDERMNTPAAAVDFLKSMNALFKWAVEAEYVESNPCFGVKYLKLKNPEGFSPWTENDIDAYEEYWPEGTRERVWLHVLLYTGLRRGDAVRLGRQHVQNGVASLKTEKSGFKTEVTLPILPVLQQTLDAGPTGDLAFICGVNGNSLTKETFGNLFRKAARAAGIIKSAHGVRKISATRAANAGATVAQLKAIFGWTDDKMPSLYTQSADRRKLAIDAIGKLQK